MDQVKCPACETYAEFKEFTLFSFYYCPDCKKEVPQAALASKEPADPVHIDDEGESYAESMRKAYYYDN